MTVTIQEHLIQACKQHDGASFSDIEKRLPQEFSTLSQRTIRRHLNALVQLGHLRTEG